MPVHLNVGMDLMHRDPSRLKQAHHRWLDQALDEFAQPIAQFAPPSGGLPSSGPRDHGWEQRASGGRLRRCPLLGEIDPRQQHLDRLSVDLFPNQTAFKG